MPSYNPCVIKYSHKITLYLPGKIHILVIDPPDGACTIPSEFRESIWEDNVKEEVNFTTWKMSGWSFEVGSQTVDDWEIVDNTRFESEGYLAFRSLDTFLAVNTTYYSFLCLKFESVSETSYKYYVLHDKEPLANSERVLVADHDDLTEFNEICNENFIYEESSYNLLIKRGTDSSITCPNPILGRFEYTIQLPDGTTACPGVSTRWDGCRDKDTLAFNVSRCDYPVAYSVGGKLSCVASSKVGGFTYIHVKNEDETVDYETTYRFSCIVTENSGRRLTISPTSCQPDQTPYELPRGEDGTAVGQKIINHVNSLCRVVPSMSEVKKSPFTVPVIVGICLGAGVMLCIIGVTVFCYCKMSYNRM